MAERSKAHDWKSCVPPKGTVSSNLTLSAITKSPFMGLFVMAYSEDKNSREVSSTTSERRAKERRSAQLMSAVNEAQRNNLTLSAIYTKAHLYGGFLYK